MKNILIVSAALFFLGQGTYLAFNGWFFKPDKVITVRFKEVPPLIKFAGDFGVYYRGYKVGKATCKKLSKDQKNILFCLEITYKNLKLPVNTEVILKTQDLFGDRYFDLVYPENPSEEMIVQGDIIEGTAVYERVDKYLVEQMETGELGTLMSNLNYLTGGARKVLGGESKELGKVSEDITGSVEDLSYIAKELKALLGNPQVKKDIKEALAYAPRALKNVNELLAEEELKTTIKQAPDLLSNTVTGLETVSRDLPKINRNMEEVNTQIQGVNERLDITNPLLCNTNQQLGCLNPKIPVIPDSLICQTQRTLNQAERTLIRYDLIGQALSKTASKDHLFLRYLFGDPGEPFSQAAYTDPTYYYCCPQSSR